MASTFIFWIHLTFWFKFIGARTMGNKLVLNVHPLIHTAIAFVKTRVGIGDPDSTICDTDGRHRATQ